MQNPRRALRRAAVTSLFVMFVFFSLVFAQNKVAYDTQPIAILASNRMATIRLRVSDKNLISASQFSGQMIRVQRDEEIFGITPQLGDGGDDSIMLELFRIIKIKKAGLVIGEKITYIGNVELKDSNPQPMPLGFISSVQLINVVEATNNLIAQPLSLGCCVKCGGVQTCAPCVEMWCGSCCE